MDINDKSMTFSLLTSEEYKRSSFLSIVGFFFISLLSATSLLAQGEVDKAKWDAGKSLFKSQCQSCHLPDKKMTGPALKGAVLRWNEQAEYQGKSGQDWLYNWVRNNSEVLAAGHPYANQVFNEYEGSVMNLFLQLSNEDIDKIFYYADNSDQVKTATTILADVNDKDKPSFPMKPFLWVLFAGLFLVALILYRVYSILKIVSDEAKGIEIPEPKPIYKNKKLFTGFSLLIIVFLSYVTASNAISLGRQQNYQPEQPIKYSHKLHAGINKIECQYCHTGASEGKHSNIPSINVCMNCHKNIQSGPEHGRKEISKIYAAIGYNPNSGSYFASDESIEVVRSEFMKFIRQDYEGQVVAKDEFDTGVKSAMAMYKKPVEWVRIHNLPDHVYFNHAQHVNSGKVECQTCHGSIEEMEVVKQHSPLSMGWCINCHRNTSVDMSNNYYQVYETFHEELKNGSKTQVTVEDIGGTECQKCHY